MGEHWLNPYFVIRSGLDPKRPAVLTYLQAPQGRILTGAAFIRVLAPDEASPEFPFAGVWHDHSGTVDEETLALNPAAARHGSHEDFRVSMLHVWTELENPAGRFAQDNWVVPFVRLGLPVPRSAGPAAGKAVFLASGGDAYHVTLVKALVKLDPDRQVRLGRELARHQGEVAHLLGRLGPDPTLSAVEAMVPLEPAVRCPANDVGEPPSCDQGNRVHIVGLKGDVRGAHSGTDRVLPRLRRPGL